MPRPGNARARKKLLLDNPNVPLAWLPESVSRNITTGIGVSARFKLLPDDEYAGTFGLFPLPTRVHGLLLEDGISKERGLFRQTKQAGDCLATSHIRELKMLGQYDHQLVKVLLPPRRFGETLGPQSSRGSICRPVLRTTETGFCYECPLFRLICLTAAGVSYEYTCLRLML